MACVDCRSATGRAGKSADVSHGEFGSLRQAVAGGPGNTVNLRLRLWGSHYTVRDAIKHGVNGPDEAFTYLMATRLRGQHA